MSEASNAFMAELKRHVSGEIQRLETPIVSLAEYQGEIRSDVDELAAKLRDVVEALVQADGALAQRIEKTELVVRTFADPALGPYDTHRVAKAAYPAPDTEAVVATPSKPGISRWFSRGH